MNTKTDFVPADYHRALGHVFFDKPLALSTFESVFSQHTPGQLAAMSSESIDDVVEELSKRSDVAALRAAIDSEIVHGEQTMHTIGMIIFSQLQKLGIAPLDKSKIYYKPYQEVRAYSIQTNFGDNGIIAKGLFDIPSQLESINFRPENAFYTDLPRAFRNGMLVCPDGGVPHLRRISIMHVYRENVDDVELVLRVRGVIQNIANRLYGNSIKTPGERYKAEERAIIDESLQPTFNSLRENGQINYKNVYRVFEWIRRENIDLAQLIPNPQLRKTLQDEINKAIPLPYAVISARVKQREREVEKTLQAFYDIRREVEPEKRFKDRYAMRVIVPTERNVFTLADSLNSVTGWIVLPEFDEDYIRTLKKPSGYKSLHKEIDIGGVQYELQLRTHEMDRIAELNPKTAHSTYKDGQQEALQSVPWQVRRVVAAIYGV